MGKKTKYDIEIMTEKEFNEYIPNIEDAKKYLERWKEPDLRIPEEMLNGLFRRCKYSKNTNINRIILKVAALNSVYNTHLTSVYDVAKNISTIKNIDRRLKKGDETLVEEIMQVTYKRDEREKEVKHHSFASKYCSFHNPKEFPIYDSYIDSILWYYKNHGNHKDFHSFKRNELKKYPKFKEIIEAFRKEFKLTDLTLKELDRYLWLFGKDHKKYLPE